jgi:hypothetical protein
MFRFFILFSQMFGPSRNFDKNYGFRQTRAYTWFSKTVKIAPNRFKFITQRKTRFSRKIHFLHKILIFHLNSRQTYTNHIKFIGFTCISDKINPNLCFQHVSFKGQFRVTSKFPRIFNIISRSRRINPTRDSPAHINYTLIAATHQPSADNPAFLHNFNDK